MSEGTQANPAFRLRLPASSANLGPGFDAVAVAFNFYLEIEATPATEFSITATGRNHEHIARLEDNLLLEIYKRLLSENARPPTPLALRMNNEIPLGLRLVGGGASGGGGAGRAFWAAGLDFRANSRRGYGAGGASRQHLGLLAGRDGDGGLRGPIGARRASGASR